MVAFDSNLAPSEFPNGLDDGAGGRDSGKVCKGLLRLGVLTTPTPAAFLRITTLLGAST